MNGHTAEQCSTRPWRLQSQAKLLGSCTLQVTTPHRLQPSRSPPALAAADAAVPQLAAHPAVRHLAQAQLIYHPPHLSLQSDKKATGRNSRVAVRVVLDKVLAKAVCTMHGAASSRSSGNTGLACEHACVRA